jgi:hypothetical protein
VRQQWASSDTNGLNWPALQWGLTIKMASAAAIPPPDPPEGRRPALPPDKPDVPVKTRTCPRRSSRPVPTPQSKTLFDIRFPEPQVLLLPLRPTSVVLTKSNRQTYLKRLAKHDVQYTVNFSQARLLLPILTSLRVFDTSTP